MPSPIRHRDSIENKVIEFFDRNPDESLFVNDAATKFNTEYTHMAGILKALADRNVIRRVKVRNCWLYGGQWVEAVA